MTLDLHDLHDFLLEPASFYKTIQEDPRYADVPKDELPTCESLELCIKRSIPYGTRRTFMLLRPAYRFRPCCFVVFLLLLTRTTRFKLIVFRLRRYWNDVIVPQLQAGKKLVIAAHGNSLRGIVKHLDSLSEKVGNFLMRVGRVSGCL